MDSTSSYTELSACASLVLRCFLSGEAIFVQTLARAYARAFLMR
jgi:hypothetical protein